MKKKLAIALFFVIFFATTIPMVNANDSNMSWKEQVKLTASNADIALDHFGLSVSLDRDTVLIGACSANGNEFDSGLAYIFKRTNNGWIEEEILNASDGAEDDRFGWSVSLDGDYAIVGAYGDDDSGEQSGSIYIFKYTDERWIEQAKLTPSDATEGDRFGRSVSIDNDTVLIGAPWDDDKGEKSGSVYVFKLTGTAWNEETKLLPSDGTELDGFGSSISIDGGTAIIIGSGSAYVFNLNGTVWVEHSKLTANDGVGFSCVSLDGQYTIFGAPSDDTNGEKSGAAYVFKKDGEKWTQHAKLTASDGDTGDGFGTCVSIKGNKTLIGADEYWNSGNGSAYIFKCDSDSWVQQAKLTPSDGALSYDFGKSVSIYENYAFVGPYIFTKNNVSQPSDNNTVNPEDSNGNDTDDKETPDFEIALMLLSIVIVLLVKRRRI